MYAEDSPIVFSICKMLLVLDRFSTSCCRYPIHLLPSLLKPSRKAPRQENLEYSTLPEMLRIMHSASTINYSRNEGKLKRG